VAKKALQPWGVGNRSPITRLQGFWLKLMVSSEPKEFSIQELGGEFYYLPYLG